MKKFTRFLSIGTLFLFICFTTLPGYAQPGESKIPINSSGYTSSADARKQVYNLKTKTVSVKKDIVSGKQATKFNSKGSGTEVKWEKTYPKAGDQCNSIGITNDGGFVMAGYSTNGPSEMYPNGLLAKVDRDGTLEWQKLWGDSYIDEFNSVKPLKNGGYIVCGTATMYGKAGEGWLVKTDANGENVWDQGIHSSESLNSNWDYLYDVTENADGTFFAIGYCSIASGYAGWIVKFDKDGNILSNNLYKNKIGWARLFSLTPTPDGGCVAVGDNICETTSIQSGWLVKFNSNGVMEWEKSYGINRTSHFDKIIANGDGYTMIGYSDDESDNADRWFLRTDLEGNTLADKTFDNGTFKDIKELASGDYAVAGMIMSDRTNYDGFVNVINSNGEITDEYNYVGSEDSDADIFTSIDVISENEVIVGGQRNWSFWLVKLQLKRDEVTKFSENFDNVTAPSLPEDWFSLVNASEGNTTAKVATIENTDAPSQLNAAFIMNGANADAVDADAFIALISPQVKIREDGATLTFSAKADSRQKLAIGRMSDPTDKNSFEQITTITLTTSFATYSVNLLKSEVTHLALKHINGTTSSAVYIDNVDFSQGLTGLTPVTEFFENFDGVTAPALPDGWVGSVAANLENTPAEVRTYVHALATSQPNALSLFNGGYRGNIDPIAFVAIASPLVKIGEKGSVLSFTTSSSNTLIVGSMTDPLDTATFEPIDTTNTASTSEFLSFSDTIKTPGVTYLALKHSNTNQYTINFIDNIKLEPILTPNDTITFAVEGENGTVTSWVDGLTILSGSYVTEGTDVYFVATPEDGYMVKEWKVNGTVVEQGGVAYNEKTLRIKGINENVSVTVEFKVQTHIVTFSVTGTNGTLSANVNSIAISSGDEVDEGSNITLIATPNEGYMVKGWTINSEAVDQSTISYSNTLEIEGLDEDKDVTVEFTEYTSSEINLSETSLSAEVNSSNLQAAKTLTISNTGSDSLTWYAQIQYETSKRIAAVPQGTVVKPSNINLTKAKSQLGGTPTTSKSSTATLSYDGDNAGGIGLNGGGTFYTAVRFPTETTAYYTGYTVDSIDICITQAATSIKLKIWDAGTTTAPGALLYETNVTCVAAWIRVILPSSIKLSGNDIWIGYEITNESGYSPAGYDAGPANANGDWISTNGSSWTHLSDLGYDYNWNIRTYISHEGSNSWLSLDTKSGTVQVNSSKELNVAFDATGLSCGVYTANIIFTSNDKKNPTITIPVTMNMTTTGIEEKQLSAISVYPNPASSELNITRIDGVKTIQLFNALGRLVREEQVNGETSKNMNISNLSDGAYTLQFILSNGKSYNRKLIVIH